MASVAQNGIDVTQSFEISATSGPIGTRRTPSEGTWLADDGEHLGRELGQQHARWISAARARLRVARSGCGSAADHCQVYTAGIDSGSQSRAVARCPPAAPGIHLPHDQRAARYSRRHGVRTISRSCRVEINAANAAVSCAEARPWETARLKATGLRRRRVDLVCAAGASVVRGFDRRQRHGPGEGGPTARSTLPSSFPRISAGSTASRCATARRCWRARTS